MLKRLINKIVHWQLRGIKTSKRYIFFESAYYIYDNSYALYKYIAKNYKNRKLFYYCYNERQYEDARRKGLPKKGLIGHIKTEYRIVSRLNHYRSQYVIAKCGIAFCSYLMDFYKNRDNVKENRKVLYLWHATMIFKSINGGFAYHFPRPNNNLYFNNPTKFTEELYLECEKELINAQMIICGKPRNDLIYRPNQNAFKAIIGDRYNNESVILCACTFRKMGAEASDYFNGEFPISLDSSQLEKLNDLLQQNNCILLIKAHHAQDVTGISLGLNNIIIKGQDDFTYNDIEVEEIFSLTSGLITDYSSIYFDYLLVNKPTAFFKCDDERYERIRGFSSDRAINLRIGYEIYTFDDLIDVLQKMINGVDPYLADKKELSIRINGDYGDNNSASVCKLFLG